MNSHTEEPATRPASRAGHKLILIGVLVLALIAGCAAAIGGLTTVMIAASGGDGTCPVDNGVALTTTQTMQTLTTSSATFTSEQLTNVKTIDQVVTSLGLPGRATLIAVTTAVGESDLINLDHGDAAGPDSAGLFQQRPSQGWGTRAQVMDPAYATRSFLQGHGTNKGLLSVPNWSTGDVSAVIHRVQGNTDPGHYSPYLARAMDAAKAAGVDVNRAGTIPTSSSTPAGAASLADPTSCPQQDMALLGEATLKNLQPNGPCPLGPAKNGTTCNDAISYEVKLMNAGSHAWHSKCLHVVALAYGGAFLGPDSALDAARKVQADGLMQPPPTDLTRIPRGAVLWFSGPPTNPYGHVDVDVGGGNAISSDVPNDQGEIGVEPITFFTRTWGQTLIGWSKPQL